MAKLEDKLFNRVIEGKLDAKEEIDSEAVKVIEGAESGTVASVLGLDSNGKLVKGAVSGGTKLYKHSFTVSGTTLTIVNNSNDAIDSNDDVWVCPVSVFCTGNYQTIIIGYNQIGMNEFAYYGMNNGVVDGIVSIDWDNAPTETIDDL